MPFNLENFFDMLSFSNFDFIPNGFEYLINEEDYD